MGRANAFPAVTAVERESQILKSLDFTETSRDQYVPIFRPICQQYRVICDFTYATSAIDQKSTLLKQIASAFRLPFFVACVAVQDLTEFYSMAFVNLFDRTFPDGAEDGVDIAWTHLQLVYAALNASFSLHKSEQAISSQFVNGLIRNTVSFDTRERDISARTLLKLHETYPTFHLGIMKGVYCLLSQGLCSNELLDFLTVVISTLSLPLNPFDVGVCEHAVLHVFSFPRIYPKLLSVVMRFLNKSSQHFPEVVSYLLYHWPRTAPAKQVFFLDAFKKLLSVFSGLVTQRMACAVFHLTAQALPSIHVDTLFAAIALVKDETVRQLLLVYPESLGEVLHALEAVIAGHWDEEARSEAGFLFATLSRYRSVPSRSAVERRESPEQTWKSILTIAQRRDRSIRVINS
jgi:hypothetical protein